MGARADCSPSVAEIKYSTPRGPTALPGIVPRYALPVLVIATAVKLISPPARYCSVALGVPLSSVIVAGMIISCFSGCGGNGVCEISGARLLLMVNACALEVPPPGPLLMTKKLRVPGVAVKAIVIRAGMLVELVTVCGVTVMSFPQITLVTPLMKLVPVKVTSSICPRPPLVGLMLVNIGAGLLTVNVFFAELPPPGLALLIKKSRGPIAASAAIIIIAVKLVASLLTVFETTMMPLPTSGVLASLKKLFPVKTTSSVCKRLPLAGAMLSKIGSGLLTVKICVPEVPPPGPLLVTEKSLGPAVAAGVMVIFAASVVGLVTL